MQEDFIEEDKWVSLSVWSPPVVQEALVNFLVEQTNRGVQLEGKWVTAYCHKGNEAKLCLQHLIHYYQGLQQLHPDLPELKVVQEDLRGEDWSQTWKSFYKPLIIGKNVVVKPTWEPYEPGPGQVVIEIDSGRAFGTGKHPSTSLCIEVLERILSDAAIQKMDSVLSVLDVGTGSGILGIVAARLGAKRVLGLDIDPEALEVAERNLQRNGVGEIMSVSHTPLDQVEETYDVVVANLTASLLTQMAAGLSRCVSPKGSLVLSGILAEQVKEVVKCFQAHYFSVVKSWSREEWQAILLRRKGLA